MVAARRGRWGVRNLPRVRTWYDIINLNYSQPHGSGHQCILYLSEQSYIKILLLPLSLH